MKEIEHLRNIKPDEAYMLRSKRSILREEPLPHFTLRDIIGSHMVGIASTAFVVLGMIVVGGWVFQAKAPITAGADPALLTAEANEVDIQIKLLALTYKSDSFSPLVIKKVLENASSSPLLDRATSSAATEPETTPPASPSEGSSATSTAASSTILSADEILDNLSK